MGESRLEEVRQVRTEADCLCPAEAVSAAIAQMAEAITDDLADRNPLVLCVMTGAVVPTAWLLELLAFPLELDYLHATRYDGAIQGAELRWIHQPRMALADRTVLLVDDILDEGVTLDALQSWCRAQGAAEVRTAVLARKLHDRNHLGTSADYIGLDVPDRYVFGAGMDYKGYWRNLPAIYAVRGT
ncbi:hypoxanthine-guanine phosphoribosyltransferase [Candidatus Macondimonas diazotrophica]|uniref:Hypoxanthine-guanine phosphoribosyltransferase n=1 Tax=Candidatus Macondimonas diazotrophica TaxID=2305248 RepID=A0A4Z0FDL8_9GAMM|nr:hypoxanthine-guanine phosphoribosyltransferase [Candidatus Macondimonas diazotrophica]NCU00027.1 hypoxanthine-guanine phosphoribosyltransferase [Candidatus Macondimonas diazotrophica]TFZ83819.1 hypoxanthine-guanine phosphoribosyltransferase [Candidatus Macondimonas diazotrophica]HBG51164.1 hypoxanthine-guanine phosphoribosyltransferase [Gammaproteobacteria bacterium]